MATFAEYFKKFPDRERNEVFSVALIVPITANKHACSQLVVKTSGRFRK